MPLLKIGREWGRCEGLRRPPSVTKKVKTTGGILGDLNVSLDWTSNCDLDSHIPSPSLFPHVKHKRAEMQ